jgi:hypothetical protein
MAEFFLTPMGRKFYEVTMPNISKSLKKANELKEEELILKQKELDLKEKELELKEKELPLIEKNNVLLAAVVKNYRGFTPL